MKKDTQHPPIVASQTHMSNMNHVTYTMNIQNKGGRILSVYAKAYAGQMCSHFPTLMKTY